LAGSHLLGESAERWTKTASVAMAMTIFRGISTVQGTSLIAAQTEVRRVSPRRRHFEGFRINHQRQAKFLISVNSDDRPNIGILKLYLFFNFLLS